MLLASKLNENLDGDIIPAKFHYDQVYYQLPLTKEETLSSALVKFNLDNVKVTNFGVELDPTVELGTLSCATYPDTFLHLVIQQN